VAGGGSDDEILDLAARLFREWHLALGVLKSTF